ncbi:formamidopyrimidine-DNA glycosylase [Microbacterium trichothecenolyticum]|uniref:DNA-formamidopyrimidine glycosylase family protein n=1 Tax=Microbacterium trichothecenolyticum TaxID=69370 RepID=UPI00285A424A|nr:DNA-formamidopyrimidine glycosylase family protein [Microbacterium trichothecenolyticum]MDR7186567.1 formamidopyrimidine-DNA glycosylase [Microbacterium trichothecenolyticum]
MPESPEVEALARFLADEASGREIRGVDVLEFRTVKTRATPPASITGRTITGARRHGKHVELVLDGASLVVSLGRHGWIRWLDVAPDDEPAPLSVDAPPALASLELSGDRSLEVTDAGSWVSLGLFVVGDAGEVAAIAKLGPDPADAAFTRDQFDSALGGRRKQIKAILQEQESLAGIGNAYSDEILHLAKVSPVTHAAVLDSGAADRLFDATLTTVRGAIDARLGVPIDQLKAHKVAAMRVHGRTGEACPACGDTIRDLTFSGTSAQYCPTCQNGGVPL